MVLVCHMISRDHVMKRSCNVMDRSLLRQTHNPAKFPGVIVTLVCHTILEGHMIKGSCDFMARSPS